MNSTVDNGKNILSMANYFKDEFILNIYYKDKLVKIFKIYKSSFK